MMQRNLAGTIRIGTVLTGMVFFGMMLEGAPLATTAAESDVWIQWRGPHRDGQTKGEPWPEKLSGGRLRPLWRVELGPSYSGPIVTPDAVFVTETKDQKYEVVRCLDRASGRQVWEAQWEGAMSVPFFAKSNGDWIRATPTYNDGRLYVAGMRDVLVCLDAKTGNELWRFDFVKEFNASLPDFGFVSSPLVWGDHLFVQAGGSLVKLQKQTGKMVWRSLEDGGGMYGSAFSSPVIATLAGREQLVVQTRSKLAGVDPTDGKVLWSQEIPSFRGMNILTPTVIGDSVFTSSYGGRSFLYKVESRGDQLQISEVWNNKVQGYMSSPVVIGGHIYLHLRNQRFTCIDAATGEERWTSKPFGKYWSLIASGDHLLALDERGELLLIKANPQEFELLDKQQVSEQETWAHLAICGREVFVRDLKAMTVFAWDGQGQQ